MRDTPRPGLALTALRYAAGELPATEAAVFDAELAVDQAARDALSEAIRLSAAALGRPAPAPDPLTRGAILDRLRPTLFARAFPRRPYRGHPLAWAGLGGTVAAGLTAFGVWLADPPAARPTTAATVRAVESVPAPRPVLVAEAAPAPRPIRKPATVVAEATPSPALAAARSDVRPPAPMAKQPPAEEADPPAIEGTPAETPTQSATDPTAAGPRPARRPAEPSSFNPSLDPGEM